jgi:NAD(P)H dehydrogenase (quinone)
MKVFIVSAHPEPQSFSTALRDLSVRVLGDLGHEVRVSDLYAMNFNPVAAATDFKNRSNPDYLVYALEQRHGYETGTLAPDILEEIEKLLWCDLLILNFPIFWFSTPAILKGWIDRVLISGLTYGGKRFYNRGGLAGRKAMVTVTLGGRPHMFGERAVHGPLKDMLRPLLRGTLYYTGLAVLPPFVAWHVPYISDDDRTAYLAAYERRLSEIDSLAPLSFPSLDAFDDRLYPRN